MPKMKPHKGLKKRFKVSASGKITYKKSFSGHLMSTKSGRRCQRLRKKALVMGKFVDNLREAMCE